MGLRMTTITKLQDSRTCKHIMELLDMGYSKRYIRHTFDVSERELERIIEFYGENGKMN